MSARARSAALTAALLAACVRHRVPTVPVRDDGPAHPHHAVSPLASATAMREIFQRGRSARR